MLLQAGFRDVGSGLQILVRSVTNISCAFLPVMTFCQTVYLLPCVTQQQNVMKYWWEDSASAAIPPASACTVVGQQDKIGGVTLEQPSYTVN